MPPFILYLPGNAYESLLHQLRKSRMITTTMILSSSVWLTNDLQYTVNLYPGNGCIDLDELGSSDAYPVSFPPAECEIGLPQEASRAEVDSFKHKSPIKCSHSRRPECTVHTTGQTRYRASRKASSYTTLIFGERGNICSRFSMRLVPTSYME